jgi:hypothetical protein
MIEGDDKAPELARLQRWIKHRPGTFKNAISVSYRTVEQDSALADGCKGYCLKGRLDDGPILIVIRTDQPTNSRLSILIHELAHAMGVSSKDADLTYAEAEVLAECVAYVVCASIGLDTSGQAVPYMTGWAQSSTEVMTVRAQLINDAAKVLEDALAEPEVTDVLAA